MAKSRIYHTFEMAKGGQVKESAIKRRKFAKGVTLMIRKKKSGVPQ